MPALRRAAMAAVRRRFDAAASPSFDIAFDLVEHPDRGLGFGERGEGFELQADLEEGEPSFESAGDKCDADTAELRAMQALEDEAVDAVESAAAARPEDDPEESSTLRPLLRRPPCSRQGRGGSRRGCQGRSQGDNEHRGGHGGITGR